MAATPKGLTMSNRFNDDKGQTAVEYLGIIAVVVAIVLAITGTDIGQAIYDAIVDRIDEVIGA
jgi:pilus assembly protein Flp/PilA